MREALGRVAGNVAWLAAGEVLLKGSVFVSAILVARGFGAAGMGTFTVAFAAALIFTQVLASGQVEVLIRETARTAGLARQLLRSSLRFQLRVGAVAVPLAVIAAALVPDAALRWAMIMFLPYAWLRARLTTIGALFKGVDRMDVEVLARGLEVAVALVVLGIVVLGGLPIWIGGLAFACGTGAGLSWLKSRLSELPVDSPAPATPAPVAREGAHFLGLSVAHQLAIRSDALALAGFGVASAEIGRYGVATACTWGLLGAAQLIAVALYPTVSRAAERGTLGMGWPLRLAAAGITLGCLLAGGIFIVRDPFVSLVFGAEYVGTARLLSITAWALPGACCSMLLGIVVASLRRQRWSLVWQVVVVTLSVSSLLVAIPRWGTEGCAWVVVGTQSLSAMAMLALGVEATRRASRAEPRDRSAMAPQ